MSDYHFRISRNQEKRPFHKHWQFCVGGGHAALALRLDYIKQLKYIHDELGIRYVRFHGVLNDNMHTLDSFDQVLEGLPRGKEIIERDFYLCGIAYDNVLSTGMKPFVELSFMPESLAREEKKGNGFYGSNFSHPKDLNAWAQYIKSFISYLLHRYGNEEVESWYFEVWNEPDLQGAFYLGTQQEYFALYEATAQAIKEVDGNLRVGGPATSGSKWVGDFVAFCHDNKVPVDFISTHQYAGDPLTGIEEDSDLQKKRREEKSGASTEDKAQKLQRQMQKLSDMLPENVTCLEVLRIMFGDPSESKEIPLDRFVKNSEVVKAQAQGLPVIYDEWNMLATFSSHSNDMRKAAAYDLKTAIDVEENVTESAVWCFSDIFEEMHQFKEEFHGGFGMLTIHGIPKPTFYAFKMLSEAGAERYVMEDMAEQEIEASAFDGENGKDVYLYRVNMKQPDLEKKTVQVQIELEKAPAEVWLERIDEDHGNPCKIWERDGKKADLTAKEVECLIKESCMRREKIDYGFENGVFSCNVRLGVNDVYHIHVGSGE